MRFRVFFFPQCRHRHPATQLVTLVPPDAPQQQQSTHLRVRDWTLGSVTKHLVLKFKYCGNQKSVFFGFFSGGCANKITGTGEVGGGGLTPLVPSVASLAHFLLGSSGLTLAVV